MPKTYASTKTNPNLRGYLSAGCVTMASYTDNGDGTITTGTHVCRLFPNADGSGLINQYTISGGTFSFTDQVNNYLISDYNGGSPILRVITDVSLINETTIIPLRTIFRNGNDLHQLDWDELGLAISNKLNKRLVKTERFARENGLMLSTSGLTTLVSAGSIWYGAVNKILSAVDSSINEFFFYYHNAGNWTYDLVTGFPNLYWDDGTDRQTLLPSKYGAVFVYRGIETDPHIYCVVDGTNSTLTAAQNVQPPANLPPIISAHCILVGRIIFQKSATSAAQVDSAFSVSFTATGVPNHNDLTGIQGGAIGEYYHLRNTDYSILSDKTTTSTLTYTSGLVSRRTYANGDYIDYTYGTNGVDTKKYYRTGGVLYLTKTAQYDGGGNFTGYVVT